jgi:hypothetical protein
VARVRSADAKVAGAITALVRPIWAYRDSALPDDPLIPSRKLAEDGTLTYDYGAGAELGGILFFLLVPLVIVTEFIMDGHRQRQLEYGELADAEGMLLLKEPESMLEALEECVRLNNYVPQAGASLGLLFFCWTGEGSTDDSEDPEWRRVSRLREVLGVEGMRIGSERLEGRAAEELLAPEAPRLG